MAHVDRIIDLGPDAGHDGGRIVFAGTPADLVAARSILTGLRRRLTAAGAETMQWRMRGHSSAP